MKLLCVKEGLVKLKSNRDSLIRDYIGAGLKENEIYETNAESFFDEDGHECYYIIGIGTRLKFRFAKLLEETLNKKEETIDYSIKKPVLNLN